MVASFKQFLAEGMIKVPKEFIDNIANTVFMDFFSYIETKLGHDAKNAEIIKRVQMYRHYFGIVTTYVNHGKEDITFEPDIDYRLVTYNPPRGASLPKLHVFIRWKDYARMADALASYNIKYNAISINAFTFINFVNDPNPQKLDRILGAIKSDIEHELAHMIQFLYFDKPSKGKATDTKDYHYYKKRLAAGENDVKDDLAREYYTSNIEFLPNVKSIADRFILDFPIETMSKSELGDTVKAFTGFQNNSDIDTNIMFKTLHIDARKRRDFTLYNKAVKSFYQEVVKYWESHNKKDNKKDKK